MTESVAPPRRVGHIDELAISRHVVLTEDIQTLRESPGSGVEGARTVNRIELAERRYKDIITTKLVGLERPERYFEFPVSKILAWIHDHAGFNLGGEFRVCRPSVPNQANTGAYTDAFPWMPLVVTVSQQGGCNCDPGGVIAERWNRP